jgi:tetratricopeptide (TPR) repeat protein
MRQRMTLKSTLILAACFFLFLAHASFSQQLIDTYDTYTTKRISAEDAVKSGSFADALDREQSALHAAEDNFGPYHPNTVLVLNDLAAIYRTMGRYGEAEETYNWALAVREKTMGMEDLLVAGSLNNLAALYEDLGRDPEAKMAEEKAIRIVEKKEGGLTPDCGPELLLLGKIQINLQDNLEAEKTLNQAVSLIAKTQDNNPGLYCESLVALAQANQASGHFPTAESHLKQSLDFCGKQYKTDSVEMADSLEYLGDFYKAGHQKKKSRECYESALKIYKQFSGMACSYPVAPYLLKTAASSQAVGDDVTARKLRVEVLATLKDSLGPDHPRVALCLSDLAGDDLALGDKAGAQKKLGVALDILKKSLGEDHPLALSVQKKLQQLNNDD